MIKKIYEKDIVECVNVIKLCYIRDGDFGLTIILSH